MKLELKHLSPYLPYGLMIQGNTHGEVAEMSEVNENNVNIKDRGFTYGWWADIFDIKPILRPLSDLTKEIEYNGEKFLGSDEFTDNEWGEFLSLEHIPKMFYKKGLTSILDYDSVLELIKRHFDIFALIPQGLAIDYNTLKF